MQRVIAFLVPWFLAACAQDGPSGSTVHSDSAGVDIAITPATDDSLAWGFEVVRTLGGDDPGPESFYAAVPGFVDTDAAGNIYVLDASAFRVLVFDSAGEFVRAMGREGGAPDEFRMVLGFDVGKDGTASLFDLGKRGIMRFAPDASPLDVVAVPQDYRGGGFQLEDGALLIPRQITNAAAGAQTLSRIVAGDTTNLATVVSPPGKPIQLASCGMGFSSMPPMFSPTLRWSAHGVRTALVTSAAYEIEVFEGDSLVRRIRREIPPTPSSTELAIRDLGDAMQVRTEGGVRRCDPQEVVEQRGVADVMPAIARLAVDPIGRLWVQRGHVRGDSAPIDVFDAAGDYLGTLPATAPFPVAFLSAGRMAAIEQDELDVTRLVIHRIAM